MQNVSRHVLVAFSTIVILLLAISAQASGLQRFDAQAFKAARQAGKTVLVEIHADWCPNCRAQAPVLDRLSGDPKYSNIVRFRVDFDNQKDVVREFRVKWLSTLVLYKGAAEVARSVGETREDKLRALLNKAL